MNKVKVVTAYSDIGTIQTSREQFKERGRHLIAAVPCDMRIFDDFPVEDTWLYPIVEGLPPSDPHPPADRFPTPEVMVKSHCLGNQKATWLLQAAEDDLDTDIFVWLDYGILKQQPMGPGDIYDFIRKIEAKGRRDVILGPGIREMGPVYDFKFCDRFCSSVWIVPRAWVSKFSQYMQRTALDRITVTNTVAWDNNYVARLEQNGPLPIRQYSAWWDRTQFTNYS